MKTRIITIFLALGLMGADKTMAQSSVTLYGIVDTGVEFLNHAPTTGSGSGSIVRETAGNLQGDRWGMKGVEDLGGGYTAVFTLENGFSVNTGLTGQNGREFGRIADVGIATPYGQLLLGRQQNLFFELGLRYDPLNLATSYSAFNLDSEMSGRADNMIKYSGSYGGLIYSAFYSTGFDGTITNGGQVPGNPKVGREFGTAVLWNSGALSTGIFYEQIQGTSIATEDDTTRRVMVGANYTFSNTKVYGSFRLLQSRIGAVQTHSDLFWAGVTQTFSPTLKATAAIYHNTVRGTGQNPTMYVMEGDYFLSKRTDLYVETAYVQNHNGSNQGIDGIGTNIVPGANQFGALAGIRHRF
jgi:predicted porin